MLHEYPPLQSSQDRQHSARVVLSNILQQSRSDLFQNFAVRCDGSPTQTRRVCQESKTSRSYCRSHRSILFSFKSTLNVLTALSESRVTPPCHKVSYKSRTRFSLVFSLQRVDVDIESKTTESTTVQCPSQVSCQLISC